MKQFFNVLAILGLLAVTVSCQVFADKKRASVIDDLWPDMVGIPPDKSVKKWVKFDLSGTMNHPFPFVWFSPQEFERIYPNVLIKLEEDGYEQFKNFVQANRCTTVFEEVEGDPVLRVTEYVDGHQATQCIMSPIKTCEYLTNMFALSKITWSENQIDVLRRMAGEFRCRFKNENQKMSFEYFGDPSQKP